MTAVDLLPDLVRPGGETPAESPAVPEHSGQPPAHAGFDAVLNDSLGANASSAPRVEGAPLGPGFADDHAAAIRESADSPDEAAEDGTSSVDPAAGLASALVIIPAALMAAPAV